MLDMTLTGLSLKRFGETELLFPVNLVGLYPQ